MSFLQTADLANAASFRARIMVGLVKVAGTVIAEEKGEMTDAWYTRRVSYAREVLRAPAPIVDAFVWPVLSNPTIAAAGLDAADGDLEYQITQVWDLVAGVTGEDKVSKTP